MLNTNNFFMQYPEVGKQFHQGKENILQLVQKVTEHQSGGLTVHKISHVTRRVSFITTFMLQGLWYWIHNLKWSIPEAPTPYQPARELCYYPN